MILSSCSCTRCVRCMTLKMRKIHFLTPSTPIASRSWRLALVLSYIAAPANVSVYLRHWMNVTMSEQAECMHAETHFCGFQCEWLSPVVDRWTTSRPSPCLPVVSVGLQYSLKQTRCSGCLSLVVVVRCTAERPVGCCACWITSSLHPLTTQSAHALYCKESVD